MAGVSEISDQLMVMLSGIIDVVIERLPGVIGALLLLLIGWLLARLVRVVAIKMQDALNRALERILSGRPRAVVQFSAGVTHLLADVLFWITWFIFIVLAFRVAGFESVARWLERLVDYLSAIFTGALIMLVGYILSSVVRSAVYTAVQSAGMAQADLLSRLAWVATLLTALIIGLDQAGVDITFITIMLGVTTGVFLAGFALAFGLGARHLVANLIAAHHLRERIEPGQRVRIGEHQGTLLDISATDVVLDTPDGRTTIPAKLCQEQPVSVILKEVRSD